MAFFFAWAWLNEKIDGIQALGGILVIAGIVLAQTSRVKQRDKELANGNS
jgi:drug/metabolite transporter (DMT)-like permease